MVYNSHIHKTSDFYGKFQDSFKMFGAIQKNISKFDEYSQLMWSRKGDVRFIIYVVYAYVGFLLYFYIFFYFLLSYGGFPPSQGSSSDLKTLLLFSKVVHCQEP